MNLNVFLVYVVLAVATAGLAIFVRALPWPKSWLEQKPLACPMCMSGWSSFVVLAQASHVGWVPGWNLANYSIAWCACVGAAAPIFKNVYPPEVDLPLP